ncbi:PAS domain-containing hybrid sensor histidine kinase/response regulator [Novosphingobium sp. FKTRR1]|uniref:hybrid sensor histidine kinase/response regulator n=1 Tax=Novosphingobium sp. FKTRR1 TaxID=2879118 RepID=UPI001CF0008E|nr:PAS domain-containing hybrid sensor histidine kinase/response regulator [Novosphingobium sp. FKTRR1]
MSLTVATLLALALVIVLFAVATAVDMRAVKAGPRLRQFAYALGLGVYCSSWTFYGAVGSAVREGWNYLPIYLAPCLVLLVAPGFMRRLAEAVEEERAASLSDFIAARFGHDPMMAQLVAVTAVCGIVPYVALQLRSIGSAIAVASHRPVEAPVMIAASVALAGFAILFGTRRYEIAGRSEGILFSVALESVIKLLAMVLVAGLAIVIVMDAPQAQVTAGWDRLATAFAPQAMSIPDVIAISVVSALAMLALPRQFYMAFTQARDTTDLPRARLVLAGYIAAMAALVLPIALAGLAILPQQASPDLFVLELPEAVGQPWMLVFALLGGISSAAAMVIVDSTALATMVSNDLIFPAVLRRAQDNEAAGTLGYRMMAARRLAIVAIIGLALAWGLLLPSRSSLASIGLVAFSAMAQFTPHLILGVLAKGRDPLAGRISLGAGFGLWLWTLALPPVLPQSWLAALSGTPFDPLHLLGLGHASPLVHGVAWSLTINLAVLTLASARQDRAIRLPRLLRGQRPVRNQGELARLTARFVGEDRADVAFPPALHNAPVDRIAARRAQDLVAEVVGAASARTLVASALAGGSLGIHDIARLLDEGGQSLQFSRRLLAATLENLPSGISVIDAELNLVAWNAAYIALFGYPPGMVRVGVPVADLIRFNVVRGDFPGPTDAQVERRLARLRDRQPYVSERIRHDGRVIKSVGGPMPGGGYLTSFTDVTGEAQARAELQATLEQLEERVAERTVALSQANQMLAESTRDKTRFLAAASHDLLQPLHAARLFTGALARKADEGVQSLVAGVDRSITGAENLLRALLDISRLDAGGVRPDLTPVELGPLLRDIAEGMRPLAANKGLALRTGPLRGVVHTDAGLLRSVLQNFVSNAVRYTDRGAVLIGVRRRGDHLRIDVVDTGVGIAEAEQRAIFTEFTRLGTVDAEGLGLGLAIVERIARLLGLSIEVRSQPGRGSRFSVLVPVSVEAVASAAVPSTRTTALPAANGLRVLVVDNERDILDATAALLGEMGQIPIVATTMADALAVAGRADVALLDYHLDHGEDGLDLADRLRAAHPALTLALVTAEGGAELREAARLRGIAVIVKPAAPAAVAAFLAEVGSPREVEPQ